MIRRCLRQAAWAALLALAACAGAQEALRQAQDLGQSGRWDEAVQAYTTILAKDPQEVEARMGLARALVAAAEMHFQQGKALEDAGQWEPALVEYTRALGYHSEHAEARKAADRLTKRARALELLASAKVFLAKGAAKDAAKEIGAAAKLAPDDPEIRAALDQAQKALEAETEAARQAREKESRGKVLSLFSTKPVTLRFKDADVREVLESLSKLADVNIFLDEAVTAKRVSLFVKDLPLREAFDLLLSTNRLFAKQVKANTVLVIPDTPAKHQQYDDLLVQTFYLNNADAKVAVNLLRTILNTRQIFVNEKLNALVVRETPEKIELAKKVLEANDIRTAEVEIGLEVLEVNRTRLRDLGISFTSQYSVTLNLGALRPGASVSGSLTTIPVNQLLSRGSIFPGSTLTFTNPSLILTLIKNESGTKTLANPTIRVLDRQKARILIGERRPIQISQISSATAAVQPTTAGAQPGAVSTLPAGTSAETRFEFRDIGLKLTMTPTIHLDGNVTLELNFEISSIGESVGGIATLPVINTRNLDSFITVKDGETRLLGGLIQDETQTSAQGTAFLSEIPLLGRLFRGERRQRVQRDVIISVTPRLIKAVERPGEDIEQFWSGRADTFSAEPPGAPAIPGVPRPGVPGAPPGLPLPPGVTPPTPPIPPAVPPPGGPTPPGSPPRP